MFSRRLTGAVAAALIALGAGASAAHAQGPITVYDPADAGLGTLRQAINRANANANLSVIVFKLPAAGTVITPNANLPAITQPVQIDGYSQPGSIPASATAAATPGVVIDAVNTTQALQLNTNDSLIQGLAIHDSSGAAAADGIQITGDDNKLKGNFVGTDPAGASFGFLNLTTGVTITGDDNVVGGTQVEDGNVIAESSGDGVAMAGDHNAVLGNRLGLPYGGGLGNAASGVSVTGNGNLIGTQDSGGRNVISENDGDGVAIAGNGNRVEGNYVGVDETGSIAIGNLGDGISIAGNQNLVSGNVASRNDAGVAVDGMSNTVTSNALGTDAGMTANLSNDNGVVVNGNANVVGGDEEDERNVVSSNNDAGVSIQSGQNNRVEGNRIGTDGTGTADLGNDYGVLVASSFNVIEDNLVSGNDDAGVKFDADGFGPPVNNFVERNVVGLDAGGIAALPNGVGVVVEDAHRNGISDNTISGNELEGVAIEAVDLAGADGNWLTGNTIEDNGQSGVEIDGGDGNLVGQPGAAANTIARNADDGVTVASGQDNSVVNNSIVENSDLAIDLAADGPTPNDGMMLDADLGPNGLQNNPNITGRTLFWELSDDPIPFLEPRTSVTWNLRSAAATDYLIELYVGDGCGRGDAGELVATRNVTTDANGLAEGGIVIDGGHVGRKLAATATVTDPNGVVLGASSELSPCA